MRPRYGLAKIALSGLLCVLTGSAAHAVEVTVTNLVSDNPALSPQLVDPSLVNPWGVSYSPTSPFWVSNNGSSTATLYNVNPVTQATTKVGLTVTIPGDGSVTGQVFNGGSEFNG
ncbi:MAG TPA: TIGR03118 family protein, partial [Burkholderiaceae bacterium]|nr:TIGR03118 family protein [Burkholderiaceae bacterium]